MSTIEEPIRLCPQIVTLKDFHSLWVERWWGLKLIGRNFTCHIKPKHSFDDTKYSFRIWERLPTGLLREYYSEAIHPTQSDAIDACYHCLIKTGLLD